MSKLSKSGKHKTKTNRQPASPPASSDSADITCGQRPASPSSTGNTDESLLLSLELDGTISSPPANTNTPHRLADSDFKLVRSLADKVSTLTNVKDHITRQIRTLAKAVETSTPPPYIEIRARQPRPHHDLHLRATFQERWKRLQIKTALVFTKVALEEYQHQLVDIEHQITEATRHAQETLAGTLKGQDFTTAQQLFGFFTRPKQLARGVKRKHTP